ncbi:hypothetical protein AMELA_G00235070 [Ameiurus melas]|uniref:Immunoglobulin domain-containing protein n=1 Tax=Ameiurus melas TaxID=219545 RepID=A0A7J6A201_AMEME|nr:hypothetical protein AMELA_G00235070 [Ameiurus melas]
MFGEIAVCTSIVSRENYLKCEEQRERERELLGRSLSIDGEPPSVILKRRRPTPRAYIPGEQISCKKGRGIDTCSGLSVGCFCRGQSGHRMKIILIFTFCLIISGSDAVTTVTGYRGRSVQIKCPYDSGYEEYKKHLCRGKCPSVGNRDIPVRSGSPAEDTRFSLYDDTAAKFFTVTITDLRTEDGNTYWCGIERTVRDIYTEILLLVQTEDPDISTSTHIMTPSLQAETTHSTGIRNYILISTGAVLLVVGALKQRHDLPQRQMEIMKMT